MKALPRSCRFFISKHVSGMCGVVEFMQRWRKWESPNCPRCGLFEDAQHVWRCKGLGTEEIWNKAVIDLEHTMRKLDTDPTLAHIITKYLKGWWLDVDTLYEPPRAFLSLLQMQTNIGWGRFFEGLWATDWALQQQRYYAIIKSTKTGKRWAAAIIQKLWNMAWDLWEHRNGILYDEENQVTRTMILQLNARVLRIYNDLSSRALRHNDRHLVHLSLSKLLKKDSNYKVTWLTVAEPALQHGRRVSWQTRTQHDRMLQGMRRGMFSWLTKP
jgi:hypothetical protein